MTCPISALDLKNPHGKLRQIQRRVAAWSIAAVLKTEFSPLQISHRGIGLLPQHLERTLSEAAAIAGKDTAFRPSYNALVGTAEHFPKTLPEDSLVRELVNERDDAAKACFHSLDKWIPRIAKNGKTPCARKLAAQEKLLDVNIVEAPAQLRHFTAKLTPAHGQLIVE